MKPCDRCVAYKIVYVKQCTHVWYVGDNKVSHMEEKLVEYLINDLKNNFGELVVTRGKKHTFLDMNINITEDKTFKIDMKVQFLEAIEAFG